MSTCATCGAEHDKMTHMSRGNDRATYCSNACRQRAYRRRRAAQRDVQAKADYERYLSQLHRDHRADWVEFLMAQNMSRQRANRLYDTMIAAERIERALPQLNIWDFTKPLS